MWKKGWKGSRKKGMGGGYWGRSSNSHDLLGLEFCSNGSHPQSHDLTNNPVWIRKSSTSKLMKNGKAETDLVSGPSGHKTATPQCAHQSTHLLDTLSIVRDTTLTLMWPSFETWKRLKLYYILWR